MMFIVCCSRTMISLEFLVVQLHQRPDFFCERRNPELLLSTCELKIKTKRLILLVLFIRRCSRKLDSD